MAGYFRIGGNTVTSKDPQVYGGEQPSYGYQGNGREVVGPYTTYQCQWAAMPDNDFAALYNKVMQINGAETTVTVPVSYSQSWETKTANLKLTGWGRSVNGYVQGVTLEVRRAR